MKKQILAIGDLPVGLRGKMYGLPFKVLIQYDIEGKVEAEIYEDGKSGHKIVSITGNKKNIKTEVQKLYVEIKSNYFPNEPDKELKMIFKDCEKLIKQLSGEVHDFNSGKNVKVIKPQRIEIGPKKIAPMKHKKISIKKIAKKIRTGKKKKGSVTRYIDKRGKENRTYKVVRSPDGHFKHITRIAGISPKDCRH